MSDQRVYNFSAGPSMLPLSALERAGSEITNYRGSGMSVMEMSHRSKVFIQIFEEGSRYADYKNVALFYKNTKTCNILKKMLHEILKIKKITTSKPHQGYLTPDF